MRGPAPGQPHRRAHRVNDSASALFEAAGLHARELRADEVPQLQALFDANPGYFVSVNGRPAKPDEARAEFDEMPPPHLGFSRRWCLGLFDRGHTLVGVAIVVADLGAPGVWHLALYLLATAMHGRGVAGPTYAALEAWVRGQGARWLRLGVVEGNTRAQRFWARQGFQAVRQREGIDTGGRINTVHVLVKPVTAGADLAAYLALMPRDRPGSTLP
jgi:GNAT superfamily N-acetyltransferase